MRRRHGEGERCRRSASAALEIRPSLLRARQASSWSGMASDGADHCAPTVVRGRKGHHLPPDRRDHVRDALHPLGHRPVRRRRARARRPDPPLARRRGRRPGVGARLGRRCSRCRCRWRSRSPRSASATPRPAAPPPTRAPRSAAARARSTGWWFLAGVVLGAPAVALVGGFYVAELLGAGREAAVVAAAAMIAAVVAANARGLHTTARLQLGLAGVLAALLLVAVVTRAAREPRGATGRRSRRTAGAPSAPRRAC